MADGRALIAGRPTPVRPVSALAATAVLAVMWAIAAGFRIADPRPGRIDLGWDAFAGVRPNSVLHAVAEGFAVSGAGLPAVLVTAGVAIAIGVLRGWRWGVFVVVASLVSELDVLGLKHLAGRTRPDVAFGVGTSFPSGHTANAALLCTVVALLVPWLAVRVPVLALAVVMAWSRTAIHAHWLTDVLAGLAVGSATAVVLAVVWARLVVHDDRGRAREVLPEPRRVVRA